MTRDSHSLRFLVAVLGVLHVSAVVLAQPANNACANAIPVLDGVYTGTTVGATVDGSSGCDASSAADVWYVYVAPFDGMLTADLCGGAPWDSVIGVWNGCPLTGGIEITCDDDACGGVAVASRVSAFIELGETYWIRVAPWSTSTGASAFTLTIDSTEGGPGPGNGPDVVYSDITAIGEYGPVGGIIAYSFDTFTCNIGSQNMRWGNSWNGSPIVGFNVYRLHNGQLVQLGLSFCKHACCAAAFDGCSIGCNGVGGSMLGVGCRDVYGEGYNAIQSSLGPRSNVNAFSGAFPDTSSGGGDAIFRRLQVQTAELSDVTFSGALYFAEGVYVASDDAPAGNAFNNASYKRVTKQGNNLTPTGTINIGVPAIQAWRDHGLGVNMPDTRVQLGTVDVPDEGRFHYGYKVVDTGRGTHRYDYAVFNLNSDRSGGSFSVPIPAGVTVTAVGFRDVFYHSGEPYSNVDWTVSTAGGAVTWSSPQSFAQNPNSNALRWGTMYNFWFEADRPPTDGSVTLGLFKPHTPQSVQIAASTPSAPPPVYTNGDTNCDAAINFFDIDPFLLALFDAPAYAVAFPDCNLSTADVNDDSSVDAFDIDPFVACLFSACP